MTTRPARPEDSEQLVRLIADFHVAMAAMKGNTRQPDLDAARTELAGYGTSEYPVFVALDDDGKVVGYQACRVAEEVVWAESLYVDPAYRRKGVGSLLYAEAERLARDVGNETPYNWVHPNNEAIIRLLETRGYTVLNLIELRRPRAGEQNLGTIRVGEHEFRY